jgi:pilus assembly protein CpaB
MNNKALTLSIVMAVMAMLFVQSYVSEQEESVKKKFGTEQLVVTAKRDIKEMETINETLLELKLVPKTFLEPAAITYEGKKDKDLEVARDLKKLSGTVAIVPIKKGEQITFNKLTEPSMRTGLAPQVAPGKRAMALPITEVTGVAKLVKPGDRVDVIGVLDLGGGKENKIAKTLLQDVVVLAVGRAVTNNVARMVEADPLGGKEKVKSLTEFEGFNSVTLEVDPSQAQAMALVLTSGDNAVTLSLRNNDDTDRVALPSMMFSDILGPTDFGRIQRKPAGGKP